MDYYKYLDMGIVHFMAYPRILEGKGPIIETLTKIAEDPYFGVVEVGQINDPEVRKEAAELLDQAHLRVAFGAAPILLTQDLNLNSPDEDERQEAVDALKEGVDQAYDLGAESFAFLSGPAPEDNLKRDEQIDLLIDSIKEVCEYVEEQGDLSVVLETFDGTVDKCCLIGDDPEEANRVAEKVKADGYDFGLLYDLSHFPMQALESPYTTPRTTLSKVSEHLEHIHIGNCLIDDSNHPAYGDKHPRFGLGEVDTPQVTEFMEALFDVGYLSKDFEEKPIVSFEISPTVGESPEIVIANAKRVFNNAWAQVDI